MNPRKSGASTTQTVESMMAAGKQNVESAVKAGTQAATKGYEQAMVMTREQLEAAFKAGADAFKGYEDIFGAGKANMEALMKTGSAVAKTVQEINAEWLALTQASIQDSVNATKALLACKNVQEAWGVQVDLAKSNYSKMVAENRKIADLSVKLSEEILSPIAECVTASVEKFSKPRAS